MSTFPNKVWQLAPDDLPDLAACTRDYIDTQRLREAAEKEARARQTARMIEAEQHWRERVIRQEEIRRWTREQGRGVLSVEEEYIKRFGNPHDVVLPGQSRPLGGPADRRRGLLLLLCA